TTMGAARADWRRAATMASTCASRCSGPSGEGSDAVRVRLLGPIDLLVDGTPRRIEGVRAKALLAALALQPGEIVGTDRLLDVVWGTDARATGAANLHSHFSRLRRVLGEHAAISARAPGYVLDLNGGGTDVQTAEQLIREAGRAADLSAREVALQAAVALW